MVVQLAPGEVTVEAAGGTDDGRFGTSYQRIEAAISAADHGRGVIILADLGSAVLTARTVLDDHPRDDVLLVDAPLVEGAVAAAVLAATGADLGDVSAAAEEAREMPKF
jgi:PTS hybrid protein